MRVFIINFPYYIETALMLLSIIPTFVFPVTSLTRYYRNKAFKRKVRQFNLVFWIDMVCSIIAFVSSFDARGFFQIYPYSFRLSCVCTVQVRLAIAGVEWTIGLTVH
jgi:hypothetical protein